MTRPKNDAERLEALLDVIEESILSATDEEIIEETRLEGRDPDGVAGKVRDLINAHLRDHARQDGLQQTPATPVPKPSRWRDITRRFWSPKAIPQSLVPIINELAHGLVTELAPHELPLFRTTWDAFVKDFKKWLKGPGRTADMLAFGLDNNTVSLTPAVLVVTTEVVHFVTKQVFPAARAEDVTEHVKEILIGPRATEEGGKAPPPLTSEQLVQIRQLAFERALRSGLPEEQARRLANALVEHLAGIGA